MLRQSVGASANSRTRASPSVIVPQTPQPTRCRVPGSPHERMRGTHAQTLRSLTPGGRPDPHSLMESPGPTLPALGLAASCLNLGVLSSAGDQVKGRKHTNPSVSHVVPNVRFGHRLTQVATPVTGGFRFLCPCAAALASGPSGRWVTQASASHVAPWSTGTLLAPHCEASQTGFYS